LKRRALSNKQNEINTEFQAEITKACLSIIDFLAYKSSGVNAIFGQQNGSL
jgi:hypothetical protein